MKHILDIDQNFVFSKDINAVCNSSIGEKVMFETKDCFSNSLVEEGTKLGVDNPAESNPISGPLFIEGINKNDSVIIEIIDIELGDMGIGLISKDSKAFSNWIKSTDMRRMQIIDSSIKISDKVSIDIEPMIGTIGVAPDLNSIVSLLPGNHGGNMDCRLIRKGALVCFPVFAKGALISMGDVHAAMGDGELGECGVEISATTTIRAYRQDRVIETPYVINDKLVSVIASKENIYEAIDYGTEEMIKLLIYYMNLTALDACHLVNLKGNVSICQICNRYKTIRIDLEYQDFADIIRNKEPFSEVQL